MRIGTKKTERTKPLVKVIYQGLFLESFIQIAWCECIYDEHSDEIEITKDWLHVNVDFDLDLPSNHGIAFEEMKTKVLSKLELDENHVQFIKLT